MSTYQQKSMLPVPLRSSFSILGTSREETACLSLADTEKLAHAFITSKIESASSLHVWIVQISDRSLTTCPECCSSRYYPYLEVLNLVPRSPTVIRKGDLVKFDFEHAQCQRGPKYGLFYHCACSYSLL